jgi:hypothetical protein
MRSWERHRNLYRRISGNQKWLSYREKVLLGRSLTSHEVREVMNMARRIAQIVFPEPALDQNYKKVKASTYEWKTAEEK